MSNNLVSQYPMSDRQTVQMEHGSDSLDFPVSEMPMKMAGQVPSNHESHHFYESGDQRGLLESIPSGSGFNTSLTSNDGSGNNDSSGVSMGSNQVWMSDQLGQEHANSPRSIPGQRASFPAKRKAELEPPLKRKAELEPPLNSPTSQQLPQSHKRPAHMGSDASSTGFLQPSSQQRRTAQMQSRSGPQVMPPQPNKKMMRNDSISAKSGLQRGQTGKRQTVQTESASKVRTESSDAVRSKMRESLAAALALAAQNQDNVSSTEKNQGDSNISHDPIDSQASHVSGSSGGGQVPVSGSGDVFPSNELSALNKTSDSQVFSAALPPGRSSNGSGGQTFQEFQYSLPDEDVPFGDNFFGKDDLLQGNGLSWAFDFDMHMGEGKEIQHQQAEKPASLREESPGDKQEIATLTPEDLAFDIETELFKLFGGANKKYREKGRSLLFNLKDRNNPELRERVMSGEISPQRLCSMSAEELASKELSEWRQAKAEELAQMKVLPDTEVDIRSLVRKTHKGEFQVEVEHDDAMAAEISGGTSVLTRPQRKKSTESNSPSGATAKDKEKVAGQGSSSEGHDFSGSLVIPTDGTDPMQGMMVDELKDSDLPPIVSLDEFMESLNNEPPFENLSRDAVQKSPTSHGESPKPASSTRASTRASEIRREASSKKASSVKKPDTKMDVSWSPAKETILPSDVPKGIWDGILQLNISSSITVAGLFRSGEKTSTKEWPTSLEIKGRVRLDAFEKFLQELPMSRTRAVMVLHFVLRDKSSEEQLSNLSEAISSYIADERLGYAEPVPGVELYLCPPASRMFDMLNKHILKERPESDKTIENGLVGVVVWRRPHITNTISPNSSSHQKHAFKKQHSFPPPAKRIQDSPNLTRPPQPQQDEDDDDIPPGFGPGAAPPKEDDDLPEFNFTAPRITPHNSLHKRPVDQVRELIKKYGQGGPSGNVVDRGIPVQPWNDDDDDIPEWRPQAPQPPRQQPYAVTHGHQPPPLHLRSSDRLAVPGLAQQPHLAPPGGARPQPPPGYLHGARWRQY